ncbi:MAG: amidophosphoribosyltransferase [Verrucomicrobia bacterium 12-59-8]|nr:MAG: amidophosphoribosyltransferase [Verrucomicrobia bacterium 12-59-8]
MNVNLKQIHGNWEDGWALDKHMLKSEYLGDDQNGRPQFQNTRSEAGEATYQLKYKGNTSKAIALAEAIAENIYPKFPTIGFIVPMAASTIRTVQPVNLVASELGKLVGIPVFDKILQKIPNGTKLKDLHSKEEKLTAIGDSLRIKGIISNEGKWNALIVDDLFDTGASMEAACKVLKTYSKVDNIYVTTFTWR